MTIANTFAAKLSVAFVALAMALSMVAPAQAQTAEELQAQIDTLMATIAALQAQAGMTAQTPSGNAYVFTRSLTIGAQGADVTALQNYLIGAGHVIPAGATGYFGTQTQAAVAAWQSSQGVMPAVGYFGPISQAKYAALMAAVVPTTPADDTSSDDSSDDSSSVTLKGEASMGDVDLKDGDDTSVEEGQEEAPVADFQIQFDNGDARISRMDVSFTTTDSPAEDVWKTFDTVSLWVDGDMVAEQDASSKSDYLGDEDNGIIRFSGLDIVSMEDDNTVITIAVTVQDGVDDLPTTWDVDVLNVRYTDADDVTSTDTVTVAPTDFDIDVAGSDDEVIIKSSSEDPDATTLQLDASKKSSFMTIFAFDIDTKDSTNDIDVNEIVVDVDSTEDGTAATTTNLLINDAMLVIDGQEFDDVDVTVNGSRFTFNIDGDLTIDAGDRVTVEFQAEFLKLASNLEGATVQGEFVSIDSEGADNITATGAAQGDEHTVRSSGAIMEMVSTTETIKANATDSVLDDEGVFTLKFDVTAFDTDLYINKTAASSTDTSNGVSFRITDGSGNLVGTTTPTASLSSTAKSETGDSVSRFVVNEGETETFTLTVNYNPGTQDFYGVQIYGLNYREANLTANTVLQQLARPATDFETDPLAI